MIYQSGRAPSHDQQWQGIYAVAEDTSGLVLAVGLGGVFFSASRRHGQTTIQDFSIKNLYIRDTIDLIFKQMLLAYCIFPRH